MSAASIFWGLVALALAVWFGWKLREEVALYRTCNRATERAERIATTLGNRPRPNIALRANQNAIEPACASPDEAHSRENGSTVGG